MRFSHLVLSRISVEDADIGINGKVNVEIISGNDDKSFRLDIIKSNIHAFFYKQR